MKGKGGRGTMLAPGRDDSLDLKIHTRFVCKDKQKIGKCRADSTSVALNYKPKYLFKEPTRLLSNRSLIQPSKR